MTSERVSSVIKDTPLRGWLVILLFRLQESSIVLNSFTLGLFLPFITVDLKLSSLEAGLLQGIWWITSATSNNFSHLISSVHIFPRAGRKFPRTFYYTVFSGSF
jgi:hypothetical protein